MLFIAIIVGMSLTYYAYIRTLESRQKVQMKELELNSNNHEKFEEKIDELNKLLIEVKKEVKKR